ncbi:MAG TPA: hypothetical protein VG860_03225 [Terriglobia bacterium]|nr:hypothetical protein [Terriglobia bacterium]
MDQASPYHVWPAPHALSGALGEFRSSAPGADFAELCSRFPSEWRIYSMGGLLRDLLLEQLNGVHVDPGDLDLVIDGAPSREAVWARLGASYRRRNSFGGAKCRLHPGGPMFDVWRIEDHTNMSEAPTPHTIEQLLRHNLLDVDAILWDIREDCLHDCGCRAAILSHCIDLMGDEGIAPRYLAEQAAHAVLIAFKTGLPLSERAHDFVRGALEAGQGDAMLRIVRRKLLRAVRHVEHFMNERFAGAVRS